MNQLSLRRVQTQLDECMSVADNSDCPFTKRTVAVELNGFEGFWNELSCL